MAKKIKSIVLKWKDVETDPAHQHPSERGYSGNAPVAQIVHTGQLSEVTVRVTRRGKERQITFKGFLPNEAKGMAQLIYNEMRSPASLK